MRRRAKTIMIQGTGSYVGKSVIVAALCRIFKQDGYRVAPFKAQNMALNSFVTQEGGEIGRAQAAQAEAAGIEPSVDMNPILLKPTSEVGAQVIVRGRPIGNMKSQEYYRYKPKLLGIIKESFDRLSSNYDVVVIEGAGSPAEINLRENDVVNMKMAEIADCPVILAGDINQGGVFAWLVGTLELLTPQERERVQGIIINKFRGDLDILKPGLALLEEKIKKPVLGVIPYLQDIKISEEDSMAMERYHSSEAGCTHAKIDIGVLRLPHISNFTDFDPLENEQGVNLHYVGQDEQIDSPDCLIIPGSKNIIDDLLYLKRSGYAAGVVEKASQGTVIIGICEGYQMLGSQIQDPYSVETSHKSIEGLGLLALRTTMDRNRVTHQVQAEDLLFGSGELSGYEIHMGRTLPLAPLKPTFKIFKRSSQLVNIEDGSVSSDRRVWGTYIHGLFDNDRFRRRFLNSLQRHREKGSPLLPEDSDSFVMSKEKEYNRLAALVKTHVEIGKIYSLLGVQEK